MKWTSRERIVAAINHHEPDRVPVDVTLLYDFYIKLKKFLSIEIDEEVKYNFAMEVIPHPEILKKLGADIISVKLGSARNQKKVTYPNGFVQDEWGAIYRKVSQSGGGSYYEVQHAPLANASIEDLEKYPWPAADLPGRGEGAEASAKDIYENTDLALMGRFGGPIIEMGAYLLGFERWMMRAASEPEFAAAFLDKVTDVQIAFDRVGIQAAAKYLHILKVSGEDLGMQTRTLYSPRMFHGLILPRLKRRWQAARQLLDEINPSVKIMLHSCGSIRKFIPDLIEAGIQVLDPVQPHAADMDSFDLKREFGEKLVFHGGIDIQQVLPFGTQQEVEEEVRARINAFAPGGGYILAPAHNVQADVPPANIVAMVQAAHLYGQYPLSQR
jgi:uroporphyrinogen decarboxylase